MVPAAPLNRHKEASNKVANAMTIRAFESAREGSTASALLHARDERLALEGVAPKESNAC